MLCLAVLVAPSASSYIREAKVLRGDSDTGPSEAVASRLGCRCPDKGDVLGEKRVILLAQTPLIQKIFSYVIGQAEIREGNQKRVYHVCVG